MNALFRSIVILLALTGILFNSCSSSNLGDCPEDQRKGAVCKDGTTSSAIGSGACSGHGGVDNWICK